MASDFHLLDLPSQAPAVQRLLKGRTSEEKVAWLTDRGNMSRIAIRNSSTRPTYRFVSLIGLECVFFLDGDQFVFVGNHTTYTDKE